MTFFSKNKPLWRTLFWSLMQLVVATELWALSEARLLNLSSSGRTALFNLGHLEGIKSGDYAVIIKQVRSLEEKDLRFVPIARARNIKMNSDSSVWLLFKVFDPNLLVKGDKYELLSESHLMQGRGDYRLGKVDITLNKEKGSKQLQQALDSDKNRLSKLQDRYKEMTLAHESNPDLGQDAEIIDISTWSGSEQEKYRSSLYRSPNKKEWSRQLRLATFEKMVAAYIQRVNDPDFNFKDFYDSQNFDRAGSFNNKSSFDNEYQRFLKRESVKTSADAKLLRTVLEKGESWSEDYSDDELRKVLNEVSILQESDRRNWIASRPHRFSFAFDYGFYLTDGQDTDNPTYVRKSRRSFEFETEMVPFLKHETLERFSLFASARANQTGFKTDTSNADLFETSLAVGANWYPLTNSYMVEVPILFVSTYLRGGTASADAPVEGDTGKYMINSFPGLRVGLRYLMRNYFGLRLIMSSETLRLDRYQASRVGSILPENSNLVENKMTIGLTYSF